MARRAFARSDFTVTICQDSNHSPEIFPFAYDTLEYISKEFVNEGMLNGAVPQITTPHSKFYEHQVHCMEGNTAMPEASIRDYYGYLYHLLRLSWFLLCRSIRH